MKSVSSFSRVLRTDTQLYSVVCRLAAPLRVLESYCSSSCYFFFFQSIVVSSSSNPCQIIMNTWIAISYQF